ncbi:MAG: hypothetical protein E7039_06055 [Lentisphaerae bacterium]|nr:hypothetical protein [Lentisphaerota bacterium]
MAVVKDNSVEFAVISGKFASNKVCKHNDVELEYGVNAFKTLAEAMEAIATDKVIFADAKTTLTQQEIELLGDTEAVYGNFSDDWEEVPVPAKNTLNVKDVETDKNFSKFLTVNVTDSTVADISKGHDVYTRKESAKTKKNKHSIYEDDCKVGYEINKTVTATDTYKKDGSVTLKNSSAGAIDNYNKVTLTNSNAGDIANNTLSKVITVTEYWVESKDCDGNVEKGEVENYCDVEYVYAASGAVTVKADKSCTAESLTVGNISGYKTVTLTGYADKKTGNVIAVTAGTITGGNETVALDTSKSVSGSVKLSNAQTGAINGFDSMTAENTEIAGDVVAIYADYLDDYYGVITEKISGNSEMAAKLSRTYTVKAANKVSVKNSSVSGNIKGYKNITLDNAEISGNIAMGQAYTLIYKRNSTEFSYTSSGSETAARNGSITIKNSAVGRGFDNPDYGNIQNYNKVTITNSVVGNVSQDNFFKFTGKCSEKDDMFESSGILERKATGSFTAKLDKNAAEGDFYTGNIEGYEKVTVTGYSSKTAVNKIVVNGPIVGGASTAEVSVYDNGYSLEYAEITSGTSRATGSATISYAEVWGDIRGYSTVTLKDASALAIDSNNYQTGTDNEVVGKSVSLESSTAESIRGYSAINIKKGSNMVGELQGTNGNDKLTIAKGAVLDTWGIDLLEGKDTFNISGTLLFSEGGSLSNLESITGNGEIAACGYTYEDVKSLVADTAFKGSVLDLGNTAYNFRGTAYEKSDDTFKKAVSFTGNSYSGWLGSWSKDGEVAGTDELDYVKVTLEEGQSFEVMGANCTILDSKGNTVGSTDLAYGDYAAGDYVFKLSIDENYGSSSSYNISIYSHLD